MATTSPFRRFRGGTVRLSLTLTLCATAATSPANAQFCLPDADGDGHPLFGNPEVKLSAELDALFPDNLYVPTAGAIGDLDGDGDLDAAVSHAWKVPTLNGAGWVSILLNDGDGIFRVEEVYPAGDYASAVAIGDLDGDGLNDLAVTNGLSNQVSVLINAGAGVFPDVVSYSVGLQPHSVVIAHLNSDAHADLAVANVESDDVSVLLGDGDGTFAPAVHYPVGFIPDQSAYVGGSHAFGGPYLAAGEIDGANGPDLVVPVDEGVAILLNQGTGAFGPPVCVESVGTTWAVAVGDMDGDGDADLVTANLADSISVLINSGSATFEPYVDYGVQYFSPTAIYDPGSVSLGDVDADGDLDVAVGIHLGPKVVVFPNLGDGTLGAYAAYSTDTYPRIATFGHLNQDPYLDLAVFSLDDTAADKLCVLLNEGNGTLLTDVVNHEFWDAPVGLWVSPEEIAFADLDNDGHLEIVVTNEGSSNINVPGNVTVIEDVAEIQASIAYPVPGFFPRSMALSDMNGDAYIDVVVAGSELSSQSSPGWVGVLLNEADGTFGAPGNYLTGGILPLSVALSDLDGDDDIDVVASNYISSDISVLLNDGHGVLAQAQLTPFTFLYPRHLTLSDFNMDGHADLVVTKAFAPSGFILMLGNGDGSFADATLFPPAESRRSPRSLRLASRHRPGRRRRCRLGPVDRGVSVSRKRLRRAVERRGQCVCGWWTLWCSWHAGPRGFVSRRCGWRPRCRRCRVDPRFDVGAPERRRRDVRFWCRIRLRRELR